MPNKANRKGTSGSSLGFSKYNNKKSWDETLLRTWDSMAERERYYHELLPMIRAGVITYLEFQPQIHMTRARIGYKPDFYYIEDGRPVYEDVKGVETPVFRIKQRLWKHYGPGILRVTKRAGKNKGFKTVKEIMPIERDKKCKDSGKNTNEQ